MKGPQVLDTARYPEILFRSPRITGDLSGTVVEGDLTICGITRPVRLNAGLYRQRGTDVDDLDKVTVQLTGAISRAAFGAGGFPGFVGDRIDLNIVARIEKQRREGKNDTYWSNMPKAADVGRASLTLCEPPFPLQPSFCRSF